MGPTVPFWALELADHAVTAVRVLKTADGALEVLSWWAAPVVEGENPVAAGVRQVHRRGLREHGLHLVLPGRGATCRSSRVSPEDADLTPGELERDLYDFTPYEPEEALLRWRRLGGAGVLDFRVVAERRVDLGRAEQAFDVAGCPYLGLSVAPAALLAARETLVTAAGRGYVLEIRGGWSAVTAFDGALTIRYPVPFGIHDLRRRFEAANPGTPFESALAANPGTPEGAPLAKALASAAEPFAQDVRRAIDFHRAAVRGTGDEVLVLAGAAADMPGLRAAVAGLSPVPFAAPVAVGPTATIRPGPRVKAEELAAALPALLVPIGAALGAAGIAPRDLDFRDLPDELPRPRERSLLPVAAAALALGMAGAGWLATDTRATMARAAEAAVAPVVGPGDPMGADSMRAHEVLGILDDAARRAALQRCLGEAVAAFPKSGSEKPVLGADRILVNREKDGYRVRLVLRVAGTGGREAASALAAAGWTVVEAKEGSLAVERVETTGEVR